MHGIGACSKALDRLGIEHEIVDAVEIDKYAMASFNAIHGTNFEPQDITTWNKDIECDLIMHGSPCQDFSLAGKQAGGDIGSGTRSSLMYETVRIVGKLRPKYVVWENVKNVLSKKHRHNFDNYLTAMKSLGYANFYEVLNAKDYGIPQNRERVFTVSILNGAEYKFPTKQELKLRLKDMLEDEVDRKYYLSDEQMKNIKYKFTDSDMLLGGMQAHQSIKKDGICTTLTSAMGCGGGYVPLISKCIQVGELDIKGLDCIKRVYSDEGISPTLTDMQGGNRQPKIMIKNATKKGYIEAQDGDSVNLAYPDSETRRGRVGNQVSQTLQCTDNMGVVTSAAMRGRYDTDGNVKQNIELSDEEIAHAITTVQKDSMIKENMAIRKLTPKECWRLMGFDDKDFEKAAQVNSNTQLYKQAGNSIVVNVLEAIFKELLKEE